MRNQTKKYIQQLQNVMHSLSLWQSIPTAADAFLLIRCLLKNGYNGYLFHVC